MSQYRMRVAYAKLGRSISFKQDKWGFQGDAEAPQLLMRLAARHPDVEWVLVGRNDHRGDPYGLAPNIFNPWAERNTGTGVGLAEKLAVLMGSLDGAVIHAGQHGTSHKSIPQSHSTWEQYFAEPMEHATTPQDWSVTYGGFIIDGLNFMGDRTDGMAPVIWVVTDPRNFLKARDVKWPTGYDNILAQYAFERGGRHERYRDPRHPNMFSHLNNTRCQQDRDGEIWDARHTYRYGGLELMILPDDWETWGQATYAQRQPAGIATTSFNDGRIGTEPRRSEFVRDYLLTAFPGAEVFGKWDPVSLSDVPKGTVTQNEPGAFPEIAQRWRCTMSLPALGSSWTVAKPFQMWASNTVCFMVDRVDDQGWILPSRRAAPLTKMVLAPEAGGPLYSIRDDWTDAELQLARWLRVETPTEFAQRARYVSDDEVTWTALAKAQRDLLRKRWDEARIETQIALSLGIS